MNIDFNAKKILKKVSELQDFQKQQLRNSSDSVLSLVCCSDDFKNIPKEAMKECLAIYVKQNCKNGRYTFQDTIAMLNKYKYDTNFDDWLRWVGVLDEEMELLFPATISEHTGSDRVGALLSMRPEGVDINVEQLLVFMNDIFNPDEIYMDKHDTTMMKFRRKITGMMSESLSSNDSHRLKQILDGCDEIEPETINVDNMKVEVAECLKN